MLAATAERADALEVLLQSKPHVAAVDALGNSALFYAARRGRVAQAERLVAAGLDPKLRNAGGWSAVDYSVQSKQDAVTSYLVQHGAQPARRRTHGTVSGARPSGPILRSPAGDAYAGWPDVTLAASRSDPAMLKSVLARGGDPEATTSTGQPALHVAIAASSPATVGALLDAGASPTRPDRAGHTPLGVAVSQGRKEIVQVLLERGASPNEHGANDSAPFTAAARRGDADILQMLLAHGAKVDTGKGDEAPLILATLRGDAATVSLLLRSGAGPEATDANGHTALWHAACRDDTAILALLLGAGANVNAASADGITPVACAAARGNDCGIRKTAACGRRRAGTQSLRRHAPDARGSWQPCRDRAQAGRVESRTGCAEYLR